MNFNLSQLLHRRRFMGTTASLAAASFAKPQGSAFAGEANASMLPSCPHPFLTPAEDFYTVARGNPKPHTLVGGALAEARLTPETWRLEITADSSIDPPHIDLPAQVEKPLTLAEGTALDLPKLHELGKTQGIKYIKAMQCLNIAEPLGQGLWEGVALRDVLRLCGDVENVRRIYYRGFHNDDPQQIFQSSVSYTQAMETPPGDLPIFLAFRLNGAPIPPVRGGPVRMIVPWAYGFKSIKWLQQIFLTNDYRANDTYALRNNDPESYLKTAAYMDPGPAQFPRDQPVVVTGRVISGLSGLERVEVFLRSDVEKNQARLQDAAPQLQNGPWKPVDLFPPPDWTAVLPHDSRPSEILGFDSTTGQPLSWPTRYGLASWYVTFRDLKPGLYEAYARSVDLNGYAQPEPRRVLKSGKNAIQFRRFEVS